MTDCSEFGYVRSRIENNHSASPPESRDRPVRDHASAGPRLALGHADDAFYLRELARQTGAAVGAAQRELERLTAAGLVLREARGKQVYFQANQKAPIFPELQGLFAKTKGGGGSAK